MCTGDDGTGDTDADGDCDDTDSDDDGDGWSDVEETNCGSDPLLDTSVPADSNGDGVCDASNTCIGDEATGDTDADGTCNDTDSDDDGDGWSDVEETNCGSNPLLVASVPVDSDGDGVCDGLNMCTGNDATGDTDADGVCDDTDSDDDGDGWSDVEETNCGSDPLLDTSVPSDGDGDGVCDGSDICTGDDATGDDDGDGVCNDLDVCPGRDDSGGPNAYDYRRALTIDYLEVGVDNTGTLPATGFPVLVSLQGSWLRTTTTDPTNGRLGSAFGYDVVFTADDGLTPLVHDLEEYNDSAGKLTAWVRVDSLSKAADTTIYMYYGNPCISSPTEDAVNVWDTGFKGVWHLDEDPAAAGAGGIKDSTASGHNGTDMGGLGSSDQVPGVAGGSINFSQSDCYIDFGDVNDFDFGLGNFAISGWIKGSPSGSVLATKSNGNGPYTGAYVYVSDSRSSWAWYGAGTKDNQYLLFDPSAMNSNWHHLVVVREGTGSGQFKIYTDGVLSVSALEDTDMNNDRKFMIHRWHDDWATSGTQIDEVRVSNTDRSYDWIRTSYNNQSNPGQVGSPGFYTVGSEEPL
jgi:hypothetical protein